MGLFAIGLGASGGNAQTRQWAFGAFIMAQAKHFGEVGKRGGVLGMVLAQRARLALQAALVALRGQVGTPRQQ